MYAEETQTVCNRNPQAEYNMAVYLSKDGKHAVPSLTVTHAAVTIYTVRTENVGHKLY
jgi:hypothetical protein